jgi:hypothetical protein
MNSEAVKTVIRVAQELRRKRDGLGDCIASLESIVVPGLWDRDIRDELPRNDDCPGVLAGGWWMRKLTQIDGITVHHTLSNSPHATARYYISKDGGRPSIPYHFWITQTGQVLYCLSLVRGCWHDHTGHKNTHISLGLAGSLHAHRPADVQLWSAAFLIDELVGAHDSITLDGVRGHCDYYATQCPGWQSDASGQWKAELFNRIYELSNAR